MTSEKKPYLFSESSEEQERARVRAQSEGGFNRSTAQFLENLQLHELETIVDLGSGGGEVLPILAKHGQRIIAVDSNSERLTGSSDVIAAFDLEDRVEFLETDVSNLEGLENSSVDMVYARLLFQHLPLDVRLKAMEEAIRITRPGGLIVAEDLTAQTWNVLPPSEDFEYLAHELLEQLYSAKGTESAMGIKLRPMFNEMGLTDITANHFIITGDMHHPFTPAIIINLQNLGPDMVKHKLITQESFEQKFEEVKNHILNENTIVVSPMMTQIAARKS